MLQRVLVAIAATAVASSASAELFNPGLRVTSELATGPSGQTLKVFSIHIDFDLTNPNAYALLSAYNHQVLSGSMAGVVHTDLYNTWNPMVTDASNASTDSYVTISGVTGFSSGTSLDPSFGSGIGSAIPTLAGWYDATPQSANTGASIKIMQVAMSATDPGYTASLRVGYKLSGTTTPLFRDMTYSVGSVVPSPGVIALLALAGAVGFRRRL